MIRRIEFVLFSLIAVGLGWYAMRFLPASMPLLSVSASPPPSEEPTTPDKRLRDALAQLDQGGSAAAQAELSALASGEGETAARAIYELGRRATTQREKMGRWAELCTRFPGFAQAGEVAEATGRYFLSAGDEYLARNALSVAYLAERWQGDRGELRKILDDLNSRLVFSPRPSQDGVVHLIQSGDVLQKIASRYNCPVILIKRINGLKYDTIRVGERLKVVKGDFSVLVRKSRFSLTLLLHGHYLKEWVVGIGANDLTPAYSFKIKTKIVDPTYYVDGKAYPFGHEKNILGTRWLGFDEELYVGLGIHGTWEPQTVGTACSRGCIRMRNEDVEELHGMVPNGAVVRIIE